MIQTGLCCGSNLSALRDCCRSSRCAAGRCRPKVIALSPFDWPWFACCRSLSSRISCGFYYDEQPDSPVVPRLLQVEAAHHCAFVEPHAGLAEPALHECRHEPVRANFPWAAEMSLQPAARG